MDKEGKGSFNETAVPRSIPPPGPANSHYQGILQGLDGAATSRRSLLIGLGASSMGLPLAGYAARAAANFQTEYDDRSAVLSIGTKPAWRIDTSWFDGAARLRVQSRADVLRIELRNAFFPGTDLPADLSVHAHRNGMEWAGTIALPGLDFDARVPFHLWLLGLQPAEGPFALSRAQIQRAPGLEFFVLAGQARFTPDWMFTATTLEGGQVRIDGEGGPLAQWRLRLEGTDAHGAGSVRTWIWSRGAGVHTATFAPGQPELQVRGEPTCFIEAHRERAQVTLSANGEGAGLLRWTDRTSIDLPLGSACLTRSFGPGEPACVGQGMLQEGQWTRFDGGAVRFAVPQDRPVLLASTESPGLGTHATSPQATDFIVAVQGSDEAVFRRRPYDPDPEKPLPADVAGHPVADILQFARRDIDLGPFDLVLRRAVDGLFCIVRFRNIRLHQNFKGWYLAGVQPVDSTGRAISAERPLIEFDFGSQHLREEAVYFTEWCQENGVPAAQDRFPVPDEVAALALRNLAGTSQYPPGLAKPRPKETLEEFIANLKRNTPAYDAFRASALAKSTTRKAPALCARPEVATPRYDPAKASHLLFELDPGETLPLSLDALFGWAEGTDKTPRARTILQPVFSKRAARPGIIGLEELAPRSASAADREKLSDINEKVWDPASLAISVPSGPAAAFHEYATRIEAPAQLVVSPVPGRDGAKPRWRMAPPASGRTSEPAAFAEVWNVRMHGVGLRALYSEKMSFKSTTGRGGVVDIFEVPKPYNPQDPNAAAQRLYRASYDARDLHELVTLTAVYGFEALCGSKQVQGCVVDDGGPTVSFGTEPPGRYMPEPMRADLLLLSSLGASFKYRGFWSPPASNKSEGALTVTRYDHDAQLGRDTYARLEYKGYLFPLGQPAILVKLTERRFCLEGDRRWVARLVQRFFIHVPGYMRSFPAVGQPHDRLWGHAETGMDTFTTPDLDDPTKHSIQGLGVAAFWPMIPAEKGGDPKDVAFDFHDRVTGTSYAAPLLFVDNNVAHDTTLMRKVVDHWRGQVKGYTNKPLAQWPAKERYFARVTSAKLPYLPGERGENTDVETPRILLGVAVPGDAAYADDPVVKPETLRVTPRMEADNQPPFYPVRRRAEIASTQLAVLTGGGSARFLLEYDPIYLVHGLDDRQNAARIFGLFVDLAPHMSFGDDTSRSGGFASPSAKIVWLSQSRGPIGGPEDKLRKLGSAAALPVPASKGAVRTADNGAAAEPVHADDFDPKEYFAQALGDAKLLGVVRLVDVLEVLLLATGTEVPTIKRQDLYDLALPALRDAVAFIKQQVDKAGQWFRPDAFPQESPQRIAAERLRPDWDRLVSKLAEADKLVKASGPPPEAILAAANEVGAACDRLSASVRAIAKDPVVLLPQPLKLFIAQAAVALDTLRTALPPRPLQQAVVDTVDAMAARQIRQQLATLVDDLAQSPAHARVRAALARVLDIVDDIIAARDDARRLLELLREDVFTAVAEAVREAGEQLAAFEQLAQDACTTLSKQLSHEVQQIGQKMKAAATGATTATNTVMGAVENAIARREASVTPAEQPLIAAARKSAVVLANLLHADADALHAMERQYDRRLKDWAGLCDRNNTEEVLSLARDALEYLLLAPERAVRALSALVEIGKAVPDDYPRLAAIWLKESAVLALLELSPQAFDRLARGAGGVTRLKESLETAAAAARALRQRLADLPLKVDTDADRRKLAAELLKIAAAQSPELARAAEVADAAQSLLLAVRALSPQAMEATVRAEVDQRLRRLRADLEAELQVRLGQALEAAVQLACGQLRASGLADQLRELLGQGNAKASSYLSTELRTALEALQGELAACGTVDSIKRLMRTADQVFELLSKAASSGNVGPLVELETIMQDIVAQLGIPTRVRISYDWSTTVSETPKGNAAIFEPLDERRLTISSVIEASLTGGKPSVTLNATLSPFAVHLFGRSGASNFLSIHFDSLELTALPGQPLDCRTDVTRVLPGDALGFVNRLSALFGGRSGFYMLPSVRGIEVGYAYSKPFDVLGGFLVQNIDFSISASLPFDNSPVRTTLKLAEKEKPFLISAGIYGGGGFLAIRTRADTLELLEASFEYGAVSGFGFGPVEGSGRITAGIYIRMGGRNPVIEGFFCAAGRASVAGLITVSAMLRVGLRYEIDTGKTSGDAVFTFKFSIGIIDYKYSANVAYARSGDGGGGGQAASGGDASEVVQLAWAGDAAPVQSDGLSPHAALLGSSRTGGPSRGPDRHPGLLRWAAWQRYWAAFEPVGRPSAANWITVNRPALAGTTLCKPAVVPPLAQGLEFVSWYAVPWGFADGKLRLGLRIMPTVRDAGSEARKNWPRLLSRVHTLVLKATVKAPNGTVSHVVKCVDLGKDYAARLEEWGLTLQQAGELWKEIFPDSLPTPQGDDRRRDEGRQIALHDSGRLATLCAQRAGQVFADALDNFGDGAAARRNYVTAAMASDALARTLRDTAGVYVPVTDRVPRQVRPLPPADTDTGQQDVEDGGFQQWLDRNVLGASAGGGQSEAGTGAQEAPEMVDIDLTSPYSLAAIDTLRGIAARGSQRRDLHRLEDPFAKEFVLRHAAYTPDRAPTTPAPAAKASAARSPAREDANDDFRKRLAGLVSHPWLLKVLGLVVDLELEGMEGVTDIHVAEWQGVVPATLLRTQMACGFPAASPTASAQANCASEGFGLLDVSAQGGQFTLTQLDVDRTPHRLVQAAIAWRNEVLSGIPPQEVRVAVQPQETVGLSLVEKVKGKAPVVHPSERQQLIDLYLDQLVVGLRPDVQALVPDQDPAGARLHSWTSLMARRIRRVRCDGRNITHWFTNLPKVDEGMLVEMVRNLDPANPKPDTLLEGERFRWDGWPLAVPRPDTDAAPGPEERPEGVPPSGLGDLVIEYEALPGATPQRFGRGYRVGVRLAMADGNSIALDEAERRGYRGTSRTFSLGDETKNEPQGHVPFLRFEPLPPPTVLIEGLPRHNGLLPEKAARAVVTLGEQGRCRRVLVPPRCPSIELAVRHGVFDDDPVHIAPPAGAFGHAVLTPNGDFPSFLFAHTGLPGGQNGTEERYFRRHAGGAVPPQVPYYPDPWARRAILAFYRASDDRLMYVDHFDYYANGNRWPQAQELQIEVVPVATVDDPVRGFELGCEASRRTVRLPPGTHLKLRVWHEMDVEMLNQSGIVDQIVQAACEPQAGATIRQGLRCTSTDSGEIRALVIERLSRWHDLRRYSHPTARPATGCSSDLLSISSFWMLNPLQEIDLLHAARLPLRDALLSERVAHDPDVPPVAPSPSRTSMLEKPFCIERREGETSAQFAGDVRLDRATTRHVDAVAHWTDNGSAGVRRADGTMRLRAEKRQGLLFQLREVAPIATDEKGIPPADPLPPELDARQHLQRLTFTVDAGKPDRRVAAPYDFGDTRARVIDVELLSHARHAAEFAGHEQHPGRHTRRSSPQRVIVPGTSRPEPPQIEYVMPLFRWRNASADGGMRRTREAGWFRIWLGPKWYSSGNGELLALVCWHSSLFDPLERRFQLSRFRATPHQFGRPPKVIEPFVTRWGLDPVLGERIDFGNMPASALRNRLRNRGQLAAQADGDDPVLAADLHHLADVHSFEPQFDLLKLPDAPEKPKDGDVDSKVVVALYRPKFDVATGRFYADIQIDPQYAYQPFVRLALARWQPHALHNPNTDLRLSRIVTTEFVQLLPERSVSIVPDSGARGSRAYRVVLAGGALKGDMHKAGQGSTVAGTKFILRVEEHQHDRAGGYWTPVRGDDRHQQLLLPRNGITTLTPEDGVYKARVQVPHTRGGRYSVVLEEYVDLPDACDPGHSRLVYFDRFELRG